MALGDLDDDGNLDIAAINGNFNTLLVYYNDGGGVFTAPFTIETDADLREGHPAIADMDGDGVNDIVFGSEVVGPGLGLQASRVRVAYMSRDRTSVIGDVADTVDEVGSVGVGDFDGDGDLDIVATLDADTNIEWYENVGGRTFETRLALADSSSGSSQVLVGDTDLDGDSDLVVLEEFEDLLLVVENRLIHRAPDFPFGRVLAREGNGITSTDYADMDGDGDLDLITGSFFDDEVIWYENPGSVDVAWAFHAVSTPNADGVTSVHAVDYDLDGDMDIAVTGILSNSVTLFVNDIQFSGDPAALFPAFSFTNSLLGANDVRSGDFSGNGYNDLIVAEAASGEIMMIRNDGEDIAPSTLVVTSGAAGVRAVYPADIDNDGDLDVLAAENGSGLVRWYDNTGSGDGTTWEGNTIDSSVGGPVDIASADFDRDGDMDVVVADLLNDEVVWFRNNADGASWTRSIIATGTGGASGVAVCDVNGDGFMDVAVANRFSNTVRYYLNSRAIDPLDSTFFFEADDSPVSSSAMGVQSVGGVDLDGDGRCDLFAGTFAGDAMIVYRNLGGQFRSTEFATFTDQVFSSTTSDIFGFTFEHLGLGSDNDSGARITSMDMLIIDGNGDPMGPSTAELVFERIEIVAPGGGQLELGGQGTVIGEITEFSIIEDGILPVPIETQTLAPNIAPGGTGDFLVRVSLLDTAAEIFPNGFGLSFTDEANVNANHLEFDDGEIEEQGDPTFSTGLIEILEELVSDCVSDCDGSGTVNFADLVCVLFLFGEDGGQGDADENGVVNFADLVTILFNFGAVPLISSARPA